MTEQNKFLSKVTKVFVASVVLASVSFGAYGLGRASESSVENPSDGVVKVVSSWQNVSSYCPSACEWELMQRMVQVTLPSGDYMLTMGGQVTNNSSEVVRFDCQVVGESGLVYHSYGQVTLSSGEAATISLHSYARLTEDFTTLKLNCGLQSDAVGVQILDASISAYRVGSARFIEKWRST